MKFILYVITSTKKFEFFTTFLYWQLQFLFKFYSNFSDYKVDVFTFKNMFFVCFLWKHTVLIVSYRHLKICWTGFSVRLVTSRELRATEKKSWRQLCNEFNNWQRLKVITYFRSSFCATNWPIISIIK